MAAHPFSSAERRSPSGEIQDYGTALRAIEAVSNLVDVADGSAELGYRIAERATGLGLATAAVRQVCELAANDDGLTSLRAATAPHHLASQAVLTRAGFVGSGTVQVDAQRELQFVRDLTVDGTGRASRSMSPGSCAGHSIQDVQETDALVPEGDAWPSSSTR